MRLTDDSVVQVGQRLRCVAKARSYSILEEGKTYRVTHVHRFTVEIEGRAICWHKSRFETVDEVVEPVAKSPFYIKVGGIDMTFDASIPKSRILVDALLDVIYKNTELFKEEK